MRMLEEEFAAQRSASGSIDVQYQVAYESERAAAVAAETINNATTDATANASPGVKLNTAPQLYRDLVLYLNQATKANPPAVSVTAVEVAFDVATTADVSEGSVGAGSGGDGAPGSVSGSSSSKNGKGNNDKDK